MIQFKLIAKSQYEEVGKGILRQLTFQSIQILPIDNYRFNVYPTTPEEFDPFEVGTIFNFTLTPVTPGHEQSKIYY